MCGLTGFLATARGLSNPQDVISEMADTLAHRGPDERGTWVDDVAGIAMGHRRLSIVDRSPNGRQPMSSLSGRYVISFNGEIYNHLAIREEIDSLRSGFNWLGGSDTETLLAAIEEWGLSRTLNCSVGMFAFALWDRKERVLSLIRDRLGEKPLYYGWFEGNFLWASELKALSKFPKFSGTVCMRALAEYVRFSYVPAPYSIYEGVYKLEPGCCLEVSGIPPSRQPAAPLRPGSSYGSISLHRWFSVSKLINSSKIKLFASVHEGLGELEEQLLKTVKIQSQADVPLGAFLSGGVDSSTIVALMQCQSLARVKTFTIGFEEAGYDESLHARAVATHLGSEHTELIVTSEIARDVIPLLPEIFDEPFADSSQIPTYLVSRLARQLVTIALSGDGGDELFGGYNRYTGSGVFEKFMWLPFPIRKFISRALDTAPGGSLNLLGYLAGLPSLADRIGKLSERLMTVSNSDDLYWNLVSEWDPASLIRREHTANTCYWEKQDGLPKQLGSVERMMFWDSVTYLPDDILCKVDRTSMACGLETRAPFLDHRVLEIAWRLPPSAKIKGGLGKLALRRILYKYIPKELIERPKAGFAVPVAQWLRGPLRDWAENLLTESKLAQEGYFEPQLVRKVWIEHLSGNRNNAPKLWSILMFQEWLHRYHS